MNRIPVATLLCLGSLVLSTQAAAQAPSAPPPTSRMGITDVVQEQRASRKEPVVAGLLSWLLPGVGSYYAGNSGHGTRHLLIWAGSITAIVIGASQGNDYDSNDTVSGVLVLGGAAMLITNTVWGIITAVHDANDANEASGLAANFAPALYRLTPSAPVVAGLHPGPRAGLRLVKVAF